VAVWAGIIIAAIGVAVSATAAVQAGQQQEQAARFNRKAAENAALAAQQAAQANAAQRQDQLRRVLASQRANIAASGVSEEGSPLLVEIDSAKQAELQRLTILHQGQQTALGFETRGAYAKLAGRQAAEASYTQAGTSLLSGVSAGLNTYQQYRTRTPPPTTTAGS
jgi:hypothetical protein